MLLVLERRGLSLPQLALQLVVEHRPVEEAEHHSQEQEGLENPLLLSGAHPVAHVHGGVPRGLPPPPSPRPSRLSSGQLEAADDEAATSEAPGPRREEEKGGKEKGGRDGGRGGPAERLSPWAPPRYPGRLLPRCGRCRRDSARRGAGAPTACCGLRGCPVPPGPPPGAAPG